MEAKIIIKNGRVIDGCGLEEKKDILIEDGIIKKITYNLIPKDDIAFVIDAKDKYVLPGFVDMHAHLRDFEEKHRETILSGTTAAVKGGFTTVACMPNTKPPIDNIEILEKLNRKIKKEAICHVSPIAAVTKEMKEEELTEISRLKKMGVVAFSDDGFPIMKSDVMKKILLAAASNDALIITHCEDKSLSAGGSINEGKVSKEMKLKGIPHESEEVMLARNLILAKSTDAKLHIAHVSTKWSVRLLEIAKNEGINVTAEVTPHHLTLTEKAVKTAGTYAKVNPPLRTEEDIEAVINGLKKGIIDIIATDHAPHASEDKEQPMEKAAFGISGFETAFPAINTFLVKKGILSMTELVNFMSLKPAKILKLKHGLLEGYPANLTIVDPDKEVIVNPEEFASKGKNTPYKGMRLIGRVEFTIVDGKIAFGGRPNVHR